jgi:hypothetical protein
MLCSVHVRRPLSLPNKSHVTFWRGPAEKSPGAGVPLGKWGVSSGLPRGLLGLVKYEYSDPRAKEDGRQMPLTSRAYF